MSKRQKKKTPRGQGAGFGKRSPRGTKADSTLVALLSQALDLPDGHCLIVKDTAGQYGAAISAEMIALCKQAGERSREVNPADPNAAIMAAVHALHPPAGWMH